MREKNRRKKSNSLLIVAAAVIFCVAIGFTFVNRQGKNAVESKVTSDAASASVSDDATGKKENTNTVAEDTAENSEVQVISEGESLIIPVNEVSSTAVFYPVEVDGVRMEVLAVADSEGNIRTAFNTCQICYGSGRGYYVQDGDVLVCQNCGNRFTIDQVEIETGGCNPWPIFSENKTVTDDTIEISYDFLKESETIFANWKAQYQ